jgi:hypothetical protein
VTGDAGQTLLPHEVCGMLPFLLLPMEPRAASQLSLPSHDELLVADKLANSNIGIFVGQEAARILGSSARFRKEAEKYFRTVHQWIQFIPKQQFLSRIHEIWDHPSPDFAVLAICMHLVIQPPGADDIRSPMYAFARSLLSTMETTDPLSLEIVQARLLICIYELGHMILPAAFLSISSAARSGVLLKLDRMNSTPPADQRQRSTREEKKRVWWAVFILDWYVYRACPIMKPVCLTHHACGA